jgi:hypothetical protein
MRPANRIAVALSVLALLALGVHAENASFANETRPTVELSPEDQATAIRVVAVNQILAYVVAISDSDYSCMALKTGIQSDGKLYGGVLCTPANETKAPWIVYALVQLKPDAKLVSLTMDRPGIATFKRDLMLHRMGLSLRDVDGLRGRTCRRGIWCLMRQILDRENS